MSRLYLLNKAFSHSLALVSLDFFPNSEVFGDSPLMDLVMLNLSLYSPPMRKVEVIKKLYERERLKNKVLGQEGPHKNIIVLDHLCPNFNVGKIYRSAEAFGVKEVHLVGIPFFNTAPAKGCFRKVKTQFFDDFPSCFKYLKERGYQLFVMDPRAKTPLHKMDFPRKSAFLVGHEEFGPSFKPEDYPEINLLKIQQFGKVESLNVSVAATLSMYEYGKQHSY